MRTAIATSIYFLLTVANCREPEIKYANYIFNEIVSSARQFGSSLNHNGMAFFLATVPAGLELYHGSGSRARVDGLDWLAFEPEHALVFARPEGNRVIPRKQRGGGQATELHGQDMHHRRPNMPHTDLDPPGANQNGSKTNSGEDLSYGYLHTYRTRSDLRLLYLDGSSAAKSDRGTLDLQDLVLLHQNPLDKHRLKAVPKHEEDRERAANLCRLARMEWQGRISGFMRMEAGFEIILCDFAKDLDLVRITQAMPVAAPPGMIVDSPTYFKAIAARADGIGGGRVKLDYEHYVSLFAYPDAIYFDSTGRPRVNSSSSIIPAIRDVRGMILPEKRAATMSVDWQAVADMIVVRYANKIDHLASWSMQSSADLMAEAERSLRPFVDYNRRNRSAETERCQDYNIPWPNRQSQSTAARAIREVNWVICSTLWSVAYSEVDSFAQKKLMIQALRKYLAWTEWKKCKGCESNEICFVPFWPIGSAEDFDKPRCVDNVRKVGQDYWRRSEYVQRDGVPGTRSDAGRRLRNHFNGSCPANVLLGNTAEYFVCDIFDSTI